MVTLTKQQVSWRFVKVKNWDNKNYTRHTQLKLILLFNKTCYFTSNIYWIKLDSSSKHLKCYSKVLHHMVKSSRLLIKVTTCRNNKKKGWFSHRTGLVFVHDKVFKVGSKNSATFKMELFATIGKVKSCKGLHLICDNSWICPWFLCFIIVCDQFNTQYKYGEQVNL